VGIFRQYWRFSLQRKTCRYPSSKTEGFGFSTSAFFPAHRIHNLPGNLLIQSSEFCTRLCNKVAKGRPRKRAGVNFRQRLNMWGNFQTPSPTWAAAPALAITLSSPNFDVIFVLRPHKQSFHGRSKKTFLIVMDFTSLPLRALTFFAGQMLFFQCKPSKGKRVGSQVKCGSTASKSYFRHKWTRDAFF